MFKSGTLLRIPSQSLSYKLWEKRNKNAISTKSPTIPLQGLFRNHDMIRRKGGELKVRRIVSVLIVLTIVCMAVTAEGAAHNSQLIVSTSNEDFSAWQWRGDAKATEFRLFFDKAQANRFVRQMPREARKPLANALADVDFAEEVAIVACLGGTSGGYRVEIGQVNINERSLLVRVGMQSPGKDDIVTMILTHPFDLVTLPREDMPQGDFEFIVFNQHGDAMVDQWMNMKTPHRTVPSKTLWHTVRTGETLWGIAQDHGVSIRNLLAVNPKLDPDAIWIGQRIRVLASSKAPVISTREPYTVRTGDSLWRIAKDHQVTVEQLMKWNNLTGYDLWIGQRLIIQH